VGPEGVASLLAEGSGPALEALLAGPDRPHARIISAAQGGTVVLVLGVALLASAFTTAHVPVIVGLLVSALGLGLAAAAGVGYWLSTLWDLLPRHNPLRPRRAE
jgi:predicted phage tail protein